MFLVMFVCLLTDPSSCREERLNFSFESVSPMACMVRSQETLAEWQQGHPDWTISRWKCVPRAKLTDSI